jgi:hypothetical protein
MSEDQASIFRRLIGAWRQGVIFLTAAVAAFAVLLYAGSGSSEQSSNQLVVVRVYDVRPLLKKAARIEQEAGLPPRGGYSYPNEFAPQSIPTSPSWELKEVLCHCNPGK